MATKSDTTKSGAPIYLFEAKTPYEVYLQGLDRQEIINLKDMATKLGKFPGLQVGSIDTPNKTQVTGNNISLYPEKAIAERIDFSKWNNIHYPSV